MEKIKQFIDQNIESEKGKDILVVIIVILVGLGSFGLGRLSKNHQNSGIRIEYPGKILQQTENQGASINLSENALQATTNISTLNPNPTVKNFFASNRGSKYYPVGCSAGKSLKQENRVYFATREEAEGAGYELSSSCR